MSALLLGVTLLAAAELDCEHARSMKDIRVCVEDAQRAEDQMQGTYGDVLRKLGETGHAQDQPSFEAGQRAWLAYRKAFCAAVSDRWGNGSIRDSFHVGCMKQHAQQRKQELLDYVNHESRPAPGDNGAPVSEGDTTPVTPTPAP